VQEALVGLPGVESVKVTLKKDLLAVRYDAARVTTAELLRVVSQEGFQPKIIAGPAAATP
jgi:copper chaperone CopZ